MFTFSSGSTQENDPLIQNRELPPQILLYRLLKNSTKTPTHRKDSKQAKHNKSLISWLKNIPRLQNIKSSKLS